MFINQIIGKEIKIMEFFYLKCESAVLLNQILVGHFNASQSLHFD